MKKDPAQQIIRILAILFFFGFFIYFITRKIYETELLKGPTNKHTAILKEIRDASSKSTKKTLVFFTVNGKDYEFYSDYDYLDMSVGDTVLIEYAISDPNVAKVIEKYYMQKYKNQKNSVKK